MKVNDEQFFKDYFKTSTIIFIALLIGQLLFAGVTYFLVSEKAEFVINPEDHFFIIIPLFIFGGVLSGVLITKYRLSAIKQIPNIKVKLTEYRVILIVKLALLEGTLLALVAYLTTENSLFLLFAVLSILIYLANRPTRYRVANDLELNEDERVLLGAR